MKRTPVRKSFGGSDGILYRGKSIKKRRRLEQRIRSYEESMKNSRVEGSKKKSLHKPGSMK